MIGVAISWVCVCSSVAPGLRAVVLEDQHVAEAAVLVQVDACARGRRAAPASMCSTGRSARSTGRGPAPRSPPRGRRRRSSCRRGPRRGGRGCPRSAAPGTCSAPPAPASPGRSAGPPSGPEGVDLGRRLVLVAGTERAEGRSDLRSRPAAKLVGRRLRSVEMITQRPTTGSLRSSGISATPGPSMTPRDLRGLDGKRRSLCSGRKAGQATASRRRRPRLMVRPDRAPRSCPRRIDLTRFRNTPSTIHPRRTHTCTSVSRIRATAFQASRRYGTRLHPIDAL